MNEDRILILGGTIWQNVIFRFLACVWVDFFETDRRRFRWLHGGPKIQSFSKM